MTPPLTSVTTGGFGVFIGKVGVSRVPCAMDGSACFHESTEVSCGRHVGTGCWLGVTLRSVLYFSFCADSGYLFSGSRPPSRVSPAGEVSLSGKETELAEGTGKLSRQS